VPSVSALVGAAAAGDQDAWNALVARFNGLVWAVARAHRLARADADDVVQTTWLRLVEHLERLDDPERVGAWLATTARRESLKALRGAARQVPAPPDEIPAPVLDTGLDAGLLASERDQALWRAFGGLDPVCQALLRMLVADPAPSYEEISEALERPIGSIGPTRARCLEKLRLRAAAGGLSREAGSTSTG
jgi:RNA polymerase sigma factor (sigma-70 family)